ncbi:M14 family zinc carboxypeptidase [Sphingobacterium sp.]|uniref:M14 family zinc carboxypeptidase n=1 Tax=Sphingobacterium sp. TaxID=341027 RepID=UPI0028AAA29A|nr:M14 family zinc carboxypeptidase [Sphingobacterium sp.]
MKYWIILLLSCGMPFFVHAQWNYPNFDALTKQIQDVSSNKLVERTSIGKSVGSEDIPLIKIQNGKTAKPTLLIVAGVDGKHPAGVVNSLNVAKQILTLPSDQLNELLANKSIWIIPVLNVDAYKRNSSSAAWYSGNARTIDNDRDGRIDEDPEVDLNKDGLISQMRIKTPAGPYRSHANNADYLVLAERNKGESGNYELYTEGRDADQDGAISEDGKSGVNLDKNFTYDYPFFEPETGDYAASEPETRAIIDLIFENPQIAAVLHFGLQNNLSVAEQFDQRKASERITKSWTNNDAQVSAFVSKIYNDAVKPMGEAPKMPAGKGNLSPTIYYHTGKFSFVTPSWWIPTISDTTKNAGPKVPATNNSDRFVNWVKNQGIQGAILPWAKVNHPDFPNQDVEVGGVVERFVNNPPVALLDASAKMHSNFVVELTRSLASLEFSSPKVTNLGDDIYRIEVKVFNTGAMPVYPEIADKIKHVSKMKSIMELQKGQSFLSGKRLQLYPTLQAGASNTFSWLVKGKGKVQLTVGCPTAGEKTLDINL